MNQDLITAEVEINDSPARYVVITLQVYYTCFLEPKPFEILRLYV